MANRVNPFRPNHPIHPGMFAGRSREIRRLEQGLRQTKAGEPQNFLVVGERGIGKSSLLLYLKVLAESPENEAEEGRLFVLDTDLHGTTSPLTVIRKIELGLRRSLAKSERARSFFKDTWDFVQRLEVGGTRVHTKEAPQIDELLLEEFSYSLAGTLERLTGTDSSLFGSSASGLVVMIDEADNAEKELRLGAFLKSLCERLQRRGCNRVMFVLAGLPEVRQVLKDSHESSLRLFEELELDRLSPEDAAWAIEQGLKRSKELNGEEITMDSATRDFLVHLSEGFPHFIQQFSHSAFEEADGSVISSKDVASGAFGKNGALELIGNRYYRDDFYRKIQKESYRQVLRIMADHLDEWVTKKEIRQRFKGNSTTLDNAIYALRSRHIIVSREGTKGMYRLQNRAFAYWLKLHATPQADLLATAGEGEE